MPVRVALLGSGVFATIAYLPVLVSSPEVTLHSIWSRSSSSSEKLLSSAKEGGLSPRAFHGPDGLAALLADKEVEAVLMVLPITSQPDLIVQCWQAGKHVLSEKPVGKDVKSAKTLIETYEKEYAPKGIIWRVAENWAHEPIIRKAAQIIKSGKLGPVLYWQQKQESVVIDGSRWIATEWRTIPDYQGGFILDGGVHEAAALRVILPDPPSRFISTASLHRTHLPPHDTVLAIALPPKSAAVDPHGPPTSLHTIRSTSQMPVAAGRSLPSGQILLTWATPDTASPNPRIHIEVTCTNGKLLLSQGADGWVLTTYGANGQGDGGQGKGEVQRETSDAVGVSVEIEMFARKIAGTADEEDYGTPRGSLWDLAVIEACLTSDGKEVDIDKLIA